MNETSQETAPQEPETKETPSQILGPIDPDLLARFERATEELRKATDEASSTFHLLDRFEAAIAKLTEATEAASRVFQGDDSLTIQYVNERVTKLDEKIERVITSVSNLHAETLEPKFAKARLDRVAAFCRDLAPLLDKHLKTKNFTALLPEKRNGTKD